MKVYAISDLHLSGACSKPMNIFGSQWENYWEKIVTDWQNKVEDNDVVLISGDISWAMNLDEAKVDIQQISQLKGKKVILKGNHDYWWSSLSKVNSIIDDNFYVVQNNVCRIKNLLVCGSRLWSIDSKKEDDKKICSREFLRLKMSLDAMEQVRKNDDCVIVMSHFPPFDVTLADNEFTELIQSHNVNSVVYGHLHGKDCRAKKVVNKGNINYYLTSCDLVNNELQLITEI